MKKQSLVSDPMPTKPNDKNMDEAFMNLRSTHEDNKRQVDPHQDEIQARREPGEEPNILTRLVDKNWPILFLIILVAYVFRSIPAWTNAGWGNDIGVYYELTDSFVKYGNIFNTYEGWGGSYQYFPVLYVIGGTVHMITGASILKSLTYSAPVFGALTVLFLYLITNELLGNKRIALLAAAFLAANPLHLYQTSHAAPLTIGHFFMLLSLYLFLAQRRKKRFILPLVVSSALLIMSHHLTTYIYIISLTGIIFSRNLLSPQRGKQFYRELIYLLAFSAGAFSYWLLVAGQHFGSFFRSGSRLLPQMAVLVFYIAVVFLLLFTNKLKRYTSRIKLLTYSGKHDSNIGLGTLGILLLIMAAGTLFITIPGTDARINWKMIIVSVPLISTVAFVMIGIMYVLGMKVRAVIGGWLGAIFLSLVLALVTKNRVLFPDRHFEYLMEPLSLMAAIGAYKFYRHGLAFRERIGSCKSAAIDNIQKKKLLVRSPTTFRKLFMVLILTVLVANGISSFSLRTSMGGFNEDITAQDLRALDWLMENADVNSTVASDHRLSQMIHGKGGFKNVTYEDTGLNMWYTGNWTECYHDINMTNETLPRVEYLLVDNIMLREGVQAKVGVKPRAIDEFPGAWEKFSKLPFELAFLDGTYVEEGVFEEEREWSGKWAAVFTVNWTYIEENTDIIENYIFENKPL